MALDITTPPASVPHELRNTYVDMPDALVDIVRPRAGAHLGSIAAYCCVPFLGFEKPYSAGKQTGSDDVEQAGRNDKEKLDSGSRTAPASSMLATATFTRTLDMEAYLYRR